MKLRNFLKDPESVLVIAIVITFIISIVISYRYYAPPENKIMTADLGLSSILFIVVLWVAITIHEQIKKTVEEIKKPPRRRVLRPS